MKLVAKINDKISIWGDRNQFMVKVQKNENSKPDYWYLPGLDACFTEIFDYLCREKLADGRNKELKEVAQIILDAKKEILEIMAPFVELTPQNKAS